MAQAVSFTKGSQLRSLSANDYCNYGVQPFIQEMLNRLVESNNFELSIIEAAQSHPEIAEKCFDIDRQNVVESFSLKPEFLFLKRNPLISLFFSNPKLAPFLPNSGRDGREIIKDGSILPEIHQLLFLCGQGKYSYEQICQQVSEPMVALLDRLIKSWVVREQPKSAPLSLEQPGVYRLQHAALLYRTKTTGILVDPQLHSNYGLGDMKEDISRAMLEGLVDGILISHNHYDHWHCPTLMMFPSEIPIFVPKVPRNSLTCEDMESRLKDLGFTNVIAVDWYSDGIFVGDIEINVLPFYGEQPVNSQYSETKHPDLRNWGNTYLLRTETYSSWFLIDSGDDPMGKTAEVAAYVKEKFGGVDWILSNFQSLSYNSIGSDISSWGADIIGTLMSNPQMLSVMDLPDGSQLSTLGAKGVAEICQIVEAKACLPYAHSWAQLGHFAAVDESLIEDVIEELRQLNCSTSVIPWRIGDGFFGKHITPAFY